MRWRLDTPKLDVQKNNNYREATEPHHVINCDVFHAPHPSQVNGHVPGAAFSDPQVNPELQKIHRGLLSENTNFDQGRMTSYRPVGTFSPSSHRNEAALQDAQHLGAGRDEDYYR